MHGGSRQGSRGHARSGARSSGGRAAPGRGGPGQADRPGGSGSSGRRTDGTPPAALPDTARLTRLLEPAVHALGLDLETVKVTTAGRRRLLRVIVDGDGGVSLDTIALASRELSARLDGSAEMGDLPYTLEVSSPGVDRPLTEPRHWRRAIGRLVVVPLDGQPDASGRNGTAPVQGRIAASTSTGVTLDCNGVLREYRYAELGPGRVQVEFGHLESDEDELDGELLGEDQDEEGLGGH